MSEALAALEVQVMENTTVEQSAIVLIQGIAAQILDLKNQLANLTPEDASKIAELADKLNASANALALAIIQNTPSA